MFGLAHNRSTTIGFAARIDQLQGIEQVATVVTLVATCFFEATDRARSLNVTVGQEAIFGFRVELLLGLAVEVLVLIKVRKEILGDAMMIFSVRMGEKIVANPYSFLGIQKALMEMFKHLSRRTTLLVGFNRDRCAVRVRAGDHEHMVALQSMVARENISRQVGARQMTNVQVTIGVRPCNGNVDDLCHDEPLSS